MGGIGWDACIRCEGGASGITSCLAIIGGLSEQFASFTGLYRDILLKQGTNPEDIKLGLNSHVYVAEDSQKAGDEFYPSYAGVMNRIGRERGWPPLSRQQFDQSRSSCGALVVGSPRQVIEKILYEHSLFKNTRFLAQMSLGDMPHHNVLKSIELFYHDSSTCKNGIVLRKALSFEPTLL